MSAKALTTLTVAILLTVSAGGAAGKKSKKAAGGNGNDMSRAIAFERHKDAAAARQARLEARRPSVAYSNSAERSAEPDTLGRRVPDPGEPAARQQPAERP